MASKVVRLIQDQNLNVHSDGAFVVGKGDAFKSTKKVGLGGRKPLGDLSNRGKPDFTKASKKPALTNFPELSADASNKKGSSKSSGKLQTSSRKPLSDVSNTVKVKPPLQKASSFVPEESSCDYEKEGYLHDHKQCIKAIRKANQIDQMDIFRMIHGPNSNKKLLSPPKASQLTKVEQESLIMNLLEIPEDQSTWLPIKDSSVSPCDSPPLSPDRYTKLPCIWEDCDFQDCVALTRQRVKELQAILDEAIAGMEVD